MQPIEMALDMCCGGRDGLNAQFAEAGVQQQEALDAAQLGRTTLFQYTQAGIRRACAVHNLPSSRGHCVASEDGHKRVCAGVRGDAKSWLDPAGWNLSCLAPSRIFQRSCVA